MTVTINGTTGLAGTNGSAGTPAVQGEDTNTGVFFPTADTVAVATGGAERLRVDSVGNLIVGATSASNKLHVQADVATTYSATNTLTAAPVAYFYNANNTAGVAATLRLDGGTSGSNAATTISAVHTGSGSSALTFGTRNGGADVAERLRITSSGQFLVGRTTPRINELASITGSPGSGEWMLECVNTRSTASLSGILVFYPNAAPNNTTNQFFQCVDGLGTTRAEIRSNGGLANFSANNVNLSDERVKTDIAPVGSYWDKIKALQVVTYKYKDQSHDDDNIGVIAQQVESVAPEFVSNDGFGETPEDGIPLKSIYEADLHYATLKALQEAMARIEALEARIAALEAK